MSKISRVYGSESGTQSKRRLLYRVKIVKAFTKAVVDGLASTEHRQCSPQALFNQDTILVATRLDIRFKDFAFLQRPSGAGGTTKLPVLDDVTLTRIDERILGEALEYWHNNPGGCS